MSRPISVKRNTGRDIDTLTSLDWDTYNFPFQMWLFGSIQHFLRKVHPNVGKRTFVKPSVKVKRSMFFLYTSDKKSSLKTILTNYPHWSSYGASSSQASSVPNKKSGCPAWDWLMWFCKRFLLRRTIKLFTDPAGSKRDLGVRSLQSKLVVKWVLGTQSDYS